LACRLYSKRKWQPCVEFLFPCRLLVLSLLFWTFKAKAEIWLSLNQNQQDFIEFVLDKYIEIGVEELEQDKFIVMRLLIDINIFENQQTKEQYHSHHLILL
jgi:transcriptional/translational regulatory protein YebC/TACO1